MTNDRYLRCVLTTIALALVYLCVVLTPLPIASAQGARTPGESTGPAEVVIVGMRLGPADAIPVYAPNPIPLTGDVKISNEVRTWSRVVITGWEEKSSREAPGAYFPLDSSSGRGLPTAAVR